jgi:hypothetical protein
MNIRREAELRKRIRQLVYYARQFNIPKSRRANEVEKKIVIWPEPNETHAEYLASEATIRKIIEDIVDNDPN